MNESKIIEALDSATAVINKLKEAFANDANVSVENEKPTTIPTNSVNLELLAKKVAYSYTTLHPEYKVDSQFNNLMDMVKGVKLKYIVSWLQRKNIDGIEQFFIFPVENQREVLLNALNKFEKEIKEVFSKRFSN